MITSRKRLLLFILGCLSITFAWANGMGTYAISAISRSSDPICREIKDINLISEKLYIRLNGGYSEIVVKYVLMNNSEKDYLDIDYAFPVDYLKLYNGNEDSFSWANSSIKQLAFYCDGQMLPHENSEDKILSDIEMDSSQGNLLRRWFYTKFSVKKYSFVNLEVRYSLENLYLCDGDSPLYHDYFYGCTGRKLTYDFSPAQSWGDGVIRDFYVELDATDLTLAGDSYNDPSQGNGSDEVLIKGLNFNRNGDVFTYRERNFDLKKAVPLDISYSASAIKSMDMLSRYAIPSNSYKVTASGGQAKYPLSNLNDMNLETAWVALSDKGAWIEFSFNNDVDVIAGFCIVGGYHKNEDTYKNNNRLKKMKIEIKPRGEDWYETYPLEAKDREYEKVYFENLFYNSLYIDFFEEKQPVEKVRLTIEEIYPGTKYNDTCISEIIFFKD